MRVIYAVHLERCRMLKSRVGVVESSGDGSWELGVGSWWTFFSSVSLLALVRTRILCIKLEMTRALPETVFFNGGLCVRCYFWERSA